MNLLPLFHKGKPLLLYRDFHDVAPNIPHSTEEILLRCADLHSHNPDHGAQLGLVLDSPKLATRSGGTRDHDRAGSHHFDFRDSVVDAESELREGNRLVLVHLVSLRLRGTGGVSRFSVH